jgi:hypothetical protein
MHQLEARRFRGGADDGTTGVLRLALRDRPLWLSSELHPAILDPAAASWPAAAWRARRTQRGDGAAIGRLVYRPRRAGA